MWLRLIVEETGKGAKMVETCPVCGKRTVGKVGVDQYFCRDCCLEFAVKNEKVKVFSILDDGTLSNFEQPVTG